MRALSASQFYACSGVNAASVRARVSRGDNAMAFGLAGPLAGGTYLDLDCVALLLVDELMPAFGRKFAPTLVRAHGDNWLLAVGLADTVAEPVWWFVFEQGPPPTPKPGYIGHRLPPDLHRDKYHVAVGTFADFAKLNRFAELPIDKRPVRFTGVNVSDILRRIRENAARAGLDLSAPFFPPPSDPLHQQVVEAAKKERNDALALFHQQRMATLAGKPAPR
jgi:hypothetical protein